MARSILDIVIKLSKQGRADRETVKGLVQVKSTVAQLAAAAGAMTGVLYTAKKAFDFAKEGAQLQFVEQRFRRLAESIGANESLMGDLRTTTRGLYSDTQLMSSAADLMGLGLANNTDELLRLAKVSSGLNMNMNQLVLTLTNMTTMRFDALGVSVDGFKEKVKDLEAAGMSANDAFKEAFLQQAEAQLERVGEAADSTAGAFMRLDAGTANYMDRLKKESATTFEPLIKWLGDVFEKTNELNSIIDSGFGAGAGDAQARAIVAAYQMQVNELADLATSYDQAHLAQVTYTAGMDDATAATETYSLSLGTVQAAISGPIARAQENYRDRMTELQEELADLQAQESEFYRPRPGNKKWDDLQEKLAGVRDEIDNTTAAFHEQAGQIMFNIGQQQILASSLAPEQQAEAIAALGQSMGQWDQQTADAITTTAGWTKLLEDGAITSQQFAQLTGMLGDSIFGMGEEAGAAADGGLSEITSGLTETKREGFGAKEQVEGVRDQVTKLNGMEATATINIMVNGSVPDLGAITRKGKGRGLGGWTEFFAEGGPLGSELSIVGEQGWEAVVKKGGRYTVIPHDTSMELARLGLLEGARGFLEGGGLTSEYLHPVTGSTISTTPRRGNRLNPILNNIPTNTPRPGATGTSGTTLSSSDYAATLATVTETVTPLVSATEQAVSSVAAAQIRQSVEARLTRSESRNDNAEQAAILRSIDRRLQRQEHTLVTAIQAAVQQVAL